MLTILTPASNTDLTTREAVLLDLDLPAGEPLDGIVGAAIGQASAAVASWCGRCFALETVRETFHNTTPAASLLLSRRPVVDIVSVVTEAGPMASDTLDVDAAAGILTRIDRRPWPAGRVIVDYRAGYVLPGDAGRNLPHDIERAAITVARGIVQAVGRDTALRSESVEGIGAFTYGAAGVTGAVTGDVAALLAPYREWGFA